MKNKMIEFLLNNANPSIKRRIKSEILHNIRQEEAAEYQRQILLMFPARSEKARAMFSMIMKNGRAVIILTFWRTQTRGRIGIISRLSPILFKR
ncbi:MAG: hypothetical protein K0R50_2771 [Eubacterium sp.]|jgi:hypothetical protein|nr:hypothetical protein [Eubacterium sp.]